MCNQRGSEPEKNRTRRFCLVSSGLGLSCSVAVMISFTNGVFLAFLMVLRNQVTGRNIPISLRSRSPWIEEFSSAARSAPLDGVQFESDADVSGPCEPQNSWSQCMCMSTAEVNVPLSKRRQAGIIQSRNFPFPGQAVNQFL